MITVDELYRCYGILADAILNNNILNYSNEYLTILEGAKGDEKSKTLAIQFIPKFAKYFPELLSQAFECQLDLCEDDNVQISRQSVKYLLEYGKIDNKFQLKVADILMQLCNVEDDVIKQYAKDSIENLISIDPISN